MNKVDDNSSRSAAVVVAHPDDETLWAGGTILMHPAWNWHIATLCRASDPDRAPRFLRASRQLGAAGAMGDLDDGPEQVPLDPDELRATILRLLPSESFDLIISHNPTGEYTRHRRHEEASAGVISLWHSGRLVASELWTFAYEDGGKQYLPRAMEAASLRFPLPKATWEEKYRIITQTYGFSPDGFEAQTTPQVEAFWRFAEPVAAQAWLERGGVAP